MSKKTPKPPKQNPWDRRPWPQEGDRDQEKLYAAVGRVLSEWERCEGILAFLFAAFVTTDNYAAARRAYSAVRTFEGRADMLRAASQTYFFLHPNEELQSAFKSVLSAAAAFSPRRNEITHGAVDHYQPAPPEPPAIPTPDQYALFPSFATFKERDVEGIPTYCYTSAELEYFRVQFYMLRNKIAHMASLIGHEQRMRIASRGILRQLSRKSTNQEPDQSARIEQRLPPDSSRE